MLDTLKVYVSSKSNWIGSWMKNPSRIVQYKDTASCLEDPWPVNFWKLEWERCLPTCSFSDSASPLWFWPLLETVLRWVGIWFGHPGRSEILSTVCAKILRGIGFLFGSSFLGWLVGLFVYLFFFLWACYRNGIWNVLITLCWLHQRGWNLPGLRCYPVWQVHTK